MICPKCENNCEDESAFCNKCGTNLMALVEVPKITSIADVEGILEKVTTMLTERGIDIDALREKDKRKDKMFPSVPKDQRDDAMSVIVQSRGLYAATNMGDAHQEDIPDFEEHECDCGEWMDVSHAYWIAMGNMEYLRIICPNCKTKIPPFDIPIEQTSRLNEKDPSIIAARKKTGLTRKKQEEILDTIFEDVESEES